MFVSNPQKSWQNRSEEHTSELQSRTVISYAVFCLKKKKNVYGQVQPCQQIRTFDHQVLRRSPEVASSPRQPLCIYFFFFNDTATTEIYTTVHTLSLHDALPISRHRPGARRGSTAAVDGR